MKHNRELYRDSLRSKETQMTDISTEEAIEFCLEYEDYLTDRELEFIKDINFQMEIAALSLAGLTEKQEKWLMDIFTRVAEEIEDEF